MFNAQDKRWPISDCQVLIPPVSSEKMCMFLQETPEDHSWTNGNAEDQPQNPGATQLSLIGTWHDLACTDSIILARHEGHNPAYLIPCITHVSSLDGKNLWHRVDCLPDIQLTGVHWLAINHSQRGTISKVVSWWVRHDLPFMIPCHEEEIFCA